MSTRVARGLEVSIALLGLRALERVFHGATETSEEVLYQNWVKEVKKEWTGSIVFHH